MQPFDVMPKAEVFYQEWHKAATVAVHKKVSSFLSIKASTLVDTRTETRRRPTGQ